MQVHKILLNPTSSFIVLDGTGQAKSEHNASNLE
jgi:hypothetical protein